VEIVLPPEPQHDKFQRRRLAMADDPLEASIVRAHHNHQYENGRSAFVVRSVDVITGDGPESELALKLRFECPCGCRPSDEDGTRTSTTTIASDMSNEIRV
jgi:hypothetical protein